MINEKNAKKYCKDDISLIENYDLAINDKMRTWVCHHRRESIYSREGLIEIGEYWERPACELIFMTITEHRKLHMTGKTISIEAKEKISKSKSGNNNPNFGKHLSKETKEKLSKANMGKGSKSILQYTKDNEFIKEWIGAREAARILGIDSSSITKCCKGKIKSIGGFIWKYAQI